MGGMSSVPIDPSKYEYGAICPRFTELQATHAPCVYCRCLRPPPATGHCILGSFAFALSLVALILSICSFAPTVPWLVVTSFNGTSSNPLTYIFSDRFDLRGNIQTRVCSWGSKENKPSSTCFENPAFYTARPLNYYTSDVDISLTGMVLFEPAIIAALLAMVIFILFGAILPTLRMNWPGKIAISLRPFLLSITAATFIGVALQAFDLNTFDLHVFKPLLRNTTVLQEPIGGPKPPSDLLLPHVYIRPGDGFNLSISAIVFDIVPLFFLVIAAAVAPRWYTGTRDAFYAERDVEHSSSGGEQQQHQISGASPQLMTVTNNYYTPPQQQQQMIMQPIVYGSTYSQQQLQYALPVPVQVQLQYAQYGVPMPMQIQRGPAVVVPMAVQVATMPMQNNAGGGSAVDAN